MASGCAVALTWTVLCCCFVCVTASTDSRCLACSYNFAGDGTTDLECVTDPLHFISTMNISCDFSSRSCIIRAVYGAPDYRRLQSLMRTCQATPGSPPAGVVCDGKNPPTCEKYCITDLCNDEYGDLHLSTVTGENGNEMASLALNNALWLLGCGLFLALRE